jgi:protein-S-isoprenylcysteine O-methyltransferase Ste14
LHQEDWARLVFGISIAACAAGEFSQAVKWRRGVTRADWRSEVEFRVVFFVGIVLLPLAQTMVPDAVLNGAEVFVLGLIIGWFGLMLRWWSFATLGRYFTTVVKTSSDQVVVSRGPFEFFGIPATAVCSRHSWGAASCSAIGWACVPPRC